VTENLQPMVIMYGLVSKPGGALSPHPALQAWHGKLARMCKHWFFEFYPMTALYFGWNITHAGALQELIIDGSNVSTSWTLTGDNECVLLDAGLLLCVERKPWRPQKLKPSPELLDYICL